MIKQTRGKTRPGYFNKIQHNNITIKRNKMNKTQKNKGKKEGKK
jgi:hypothetical protein